MQHFSNTLHRPEFEHEGGGVGFIARTSGQTGHQIVELALEAVGRMEHRSATDADGLSGDGAGILTQIPHRLLEAEIDDLPPLGDYALGMLFLPPDDHSQPAIQLVESVLRDILQPPGGKTHKPQAAPGNLIWRSVPVNSDSLGRTARASRPDIRQFVIFRPPYVEPGAAFERFLFTARKKLEAAARQAGLDRLYVATLSSQTVVYKGLMLSPYLADFFMDLGNPHFETAFATFHARYSTNTTSNWQSAQPFRMLAHNGKINTLQGNVNWMQARESILASPFWPNGLADLRPIIDRSGSDSAMLDNVLELLALGGRDIHHAMAMLTPETWENLADLHPNRHAFYRYHAALMEPWDGPAALVFSDGRRVGAVLDRNGLRPLRYLTTNDDLVVATSEAGVVTIDEGSIVAKGKLGPGQMILVDLERRIFLTNELVKNELARRPHYQKWVSGLKPLPTESRPAYFSLKHNNHLLTQPKVNTTAGWLTRLQTAFGYTNEEIFAIKRPMAGEGKEPTGSMGNDTPPGVLSLKPRPLFHYFKQRFAQVTNPPLDPLRETLVMSSTMRLGPRPNLLEETPNHANLIELASPVLGDADLVALKGLGDPRFQTYTIPIRYPVEQGTGGLRRALDRLCAMAERAVDEGKTIIILSDLGVDQRHAPIPNLLAVGAVHYHLMRQGKRMQASLVVESGEVREVHNLACLIGYGANAVNPYLALATIEGLVEAGKIKLEVNQAKLNFIRAMEAGLLKIMSKIGISTADSYCGAQVFEAVGLGQKVVDEFFSGTVSRLGGLELSDIAAEVGRWHRAAFVDSRSPKSPGFYKYKRDGELHAYDPLLARVPAPAVSSNGEGHRIDPANRVGDLNRYLVAETQAAIATVQAIDLTLSINNMDRTVGATLSGAITRRYGERGLPDGTINLTFHGSAGQSFGAFNAVGVNLTLIGEANDYVGKGMGGGQIVIRPPLKSTLVASENVIMGNTVLYGATGGSLFVAGQAGERFALRNSGATAVVEGLGDHGCEYMSGGVVVVLGRTGYNFGAGMSGGLAFVLDERDRLPRRINPDMVQLVRVTTQADLELLRYLITRHIRLTGSVHGRSVLDNWSTRLGLFWKVAPKGTVGSTGVRQEVQLSLPAQRLSRHMVG